MRSLTAFLATEAVQCENVLFVASERFIDPDTVQPVEWEIKTITAGENSAIRKQCTRTIQVAGKKNQFTQEFDTGAYQLKLAVACTVWPELRAKELQDSYGVISAEDLLAKMLNSGEYEDYCAKVFEVNGFTSATERVEEAKN